MLNKNDAIPLYIQVERILRKEIMTGIYREGDIIPSESQMSQQYDITRTTVRRAISRLVNDGLLTQVHGKGTYVCFKEVKYNIWNFGGFTDYIMKRGEQPYSLVLKKEIIEFDGEPYLILNRARGVKKGNDIIFLTIDNSKIPLAALPGFENYDFSLNSIYNIMRTAYGIFPKRAELSMNSTLCDSIMKKTFKLTKDVPLLLAAGNVYDTNNKNIENVTVIYGPNINFRVVVNMEL
jgi:DNA-binding GntR family transcriptional regulator